MAGSRLEEMSKEEIEELWKDLAPAPKYYQAKMTASSKARYAVGKELLRRGYSFPEMGALVQMTNQQVAAFLNDKRKEVKLRSRRGNIRELKEEAEKAKRELALFKALSATGGTHMIVENPEGKY